LVRGNRATGAVQAFGTLILARLRWAQENRFLSSMLAIFVPYFPEHKRGFANASIVAGMAMGQAVGTLAGEF